MVICNLVMWLLHMTCHVGHLGLVRVGRAGLGVGVDAWVGRIGALRHRVVRRH